MIKSNNLIPDVVHPVEPRLQVVVRNDFQLSVSDGVCSLFAHLCAADIPLGLHQRLHNVFGATVGTVTSLLLEGQRSWTSGKSFKHNTNRFAKCSELQISTYLQTGTTMGLSLISLNWPLSMRAWSTAFLASKRFMPWKTHNKSAFKQKRLDDLPCHVGNTQQQKEKKKNYSFFFQWNKDLCKSLRRDQYWKLIRNSWESFINRWISRAKQKHWC